MASHAFSRASGSSRSIRHALLVRARRWMVTFAEDPARWQEDIFVQTYGKLLPVRHEKHEAFMTAASALRQQTNLPLDLRASAGRMQASVLFRQAASLFQELKTSMNKPWPIDQFDEAMFAATWACRAYDEAAMDTKDSELHAAMVHQCPDWPDVVRNVEVVQAQARQMRAHLHLRQVKWYARQAERARDVSQLASQGMDNSRVVEVLEEVGLSQDASEQELWSKAADAAQRLCEECPAGSVGDGEAEEVLRQLVAEGYVLLVVCLKNSALSHAAQDQLVEAVPHLVRALGVRVQPKDALDPETVEQLRAASQAVLQRLSRELQQSDSKEDCQKFADLGWDIGEATKQFNEWRDTQ